MNRKTIIKIILAVVVILVVMKGVSFVYDKIQVMNAPTMQEISEANPWTVPADWFKTDTITIKGRIEDYDAEQFGFTSMACYYDDVFEKGSTVLVLDIADDGTFCKKFLASYPVCNSFIADGSKVFFNAIRFFARPGETIDITVRKASFWRYGCVSSTWLNGWPTKRPFASPTPSSDACKSCSSSSASLTTRPLLPTAAASVKISASAATTTSTTIWKGSWRS